MGYVNSLVHYRAAFFEDSHNSRHNMETEEYIAHWPEHFRCTTCGSEGDDPRSSALNKALAGRESRFTLYALNEPYRYGSHVCECGGIWWCVQCLL